MKSLVLALLLLSVPLTAQTVQTGDGKISIADIGQLPTSNYSSLPSCTSTKDGKSFRVTDANRDVYTCHGSSAKWVSRNGGIYNIGDFGAAGDGTSDDTVAIQAALDAAGTAGGGRVVAVAGKTYLVSRNTSLQYVFGSITIVPALGVPSNVTFDLNTATFKLAATGGLRASMICNKSGATNIEITNGFLDSATQTATTSGHEISLIGLFNSSQTRVTRIIAKTGIDYAGRFLGVTNGYWDALLCLASEADAWSFGISTTGGNDYRIIRSHIGSVEAHDVGSNLANHGTLQGNPVIITAKNSTVGSIIAENAAAGVKIQDESERVIIGSVVNVGGAYGTANSGIKIQGNGAGLVPVDIAIASAISRDCYSEGLHIVYSSNVRIGSYNGYNNGTNAPQRDVFVQNATVTFGGVVSTNPTSMGVSISGTGDSVVADSITIVAGPGTSRGVQLSSTGAYFKANTISGSDSQGSPTLNIILDVEDTTAFGAVRNIISDFTPTSSRSLLKSSTSMLLDIDEVTIAGYQTTGVATLSAGNSTSVSTPSAFRVYVGGTSYIQPLITLTPLNTAAGNLPTLLAVTSGDLNTTGFTISHSNASGSEIVAWKISRWRVGSVPSLSFIGSLLLPYTAKTSTYSATNSDVTIDCTSGSFTVTLPTAVGVTGKVYVVKNSGAGTITLATTSGQTIDGSSPGTISAGSVKRLQSTGANWISW